VRKLGVKLLSDPYTDKPNVRLYGYQRVGGGVSNFEALKFLKFGDS
jgi:HK97 family phage major capsid protein